MIDNLKRKILAKTCSHDDVEISTVPLGRRSIKVNSYTVKGYCRDCNCHVETDINWKVQKWVFHRFDK